MRRSISGRRCEQMPGACTPPSRSRREASHRPRAHLRTHLRLLPDEEMDWPGAAVPVDSAGVSKLDRLARPDFLDRVGGREREREKHRRERDTASGCHPHDPIRTGDKLQPRLRNLSLLFHVAKVSLHG
uniref:Uncharacterized protein n=1 Tax=Molossus molossus TaxID=27622 RepID=A0A7J8JW48_MOLMO|nr:hypothetical protein HJG59_007991 [Molossus molossus]